MVVSLRGKVDGKEIVFERISQDVWKSAIPKELYGFYVVELEAYDEAGNRAYATKFLLTVDLENLVIKLIPCNYQAVLLDSEYKTELYMSQYVAHLEKGNGDENVPDYGFGRGKAHQDQS